MAFAVIVHPALAARPLRSEYVSGSYFSTFGIGAFGGRMFTEDDDRPSATPVAVLSHHSWQGTYGRDPSVINNFNGLVGVANVRMTGLGTDTTSGATAPYTFEADMRFMKGVFVDSAGQTQRGAFVLI